MGDEAGVGEGKWGRLQKGEEDWAGPVCVVSISLEVGLGKKVRSTRKKTWAGSRQLSTSCQISKYPIKLKLCDLGQVEDVIKILRERKALDNIKCSFLIRKCTTLGSHWGPEVLSKGR